MTEESAAVLRQWQLIRDLLDSFEKGETDIGNLVADLNALWAALPEEPQDVRREVRGHWWTLEQLLAIGLDRGDLAAVIAENRSVLDDTVRELRQLATAALDNR
jgi:hypothetical protein